MPPSKLAGIHLYRLTSAFPLLKTTSPRRHLPEHDSFQLFSFLSLNLCRHCSPTQNAFPCLVHETLESESEAAQSCPTLCDPMDCSWPGPSIHGIFQAWILEWVPFSFPGDLPDPGLNSGFPHCRQTLYPLSYRGTPTHCEIQHDNSSFLEPETEERVSCISFIKGLFFLLILFLRKNLEEREESGGVKVKD